MPYIKQICRGGIDRWLELIPSFALSPSELNYIITKLLLRIEPMSYQDYNSLIGVLEMVKQEFYRRMVVPYEIRKMEENGDVYPPPPEEVPLETLSALELMKKNTPTKKRK